MSGGLKPNERGEGKKGKKREDRAAQDRAALQTVFI